jgi:hypothetical protein
MLPAEDPRVLDLWYGKGKWALYVLMALLAFGVIFFFVTM